MIAHPEIPIRDIEAQQDHELSSIEAGVRRYRKELAKATAGELYSTTVPGRWAAMDCLRTFVPAIQAAQREAIEGISHHKFGTHHEQWWWVLAYISPEAAGWGTFTTILNLGTVGKQLPGVPIGRAVSAIGRLMQLEVEFQAWRAREAADAKTHPRGLDVAKMLLEEAGDVSPALFRRWKVHMRKVEDLDWTIGMIAAIGAKLLHLMVTQGGGWFEIRTGFIRGKTIRSVVLSDVAKEALKDKESYLELMTPLMNPMICPPKPWILEPA